MMKSFFAVLCAICTFPAVGAPPEKAPLLELPVPVSALKETSQAAYGIYVNGGKAGWGAIGFAPGKSGTKDCVDYRSNFKIEMNALGNITRIEMMELEQFDLAPPHRALLLEERQKMDGQERRVTLRLKEGTTYAVEVMEAGKTRASDDVTFDLRLTHCVSPETWSMDPQRKPGDAAGTVEFDFEALKIDAYTATILKPAEWTGPGGKMPVWEMDLYNHQKRLSIKSSISRTDGTMVHGSMGDMIEMRLEPEAVAKQKPGAQADLFPGRVNTNAGLPRSGQNG